MKGRFSLSILLLALCWVASVRGQACEILGFAASNYTNLPDLDAYRFQGVWYEIRKDWWSYQITGQTCVVDEFEARGSTDLSLKRSFTWLGFIPWIDIIPKTISWSPLDNKLYQNQFPLKKVSYNVLSTDYENYAVIYGCTNRFFGLIPEVHAAVLSRTKHLSEPFIRKCQEAVKLANQDYYWLFDNAYSENCGYSAAASYDLSVISLLRKHPRWKKYSGSTNSKFKALYMGSDAYEPYGYLTEEIRIGKKVFNKDPLERLIVDSFYQEYVVLEDIMVHHPHEDNAQRDNDEKTYGAKADVWLLVEGLTQDQVASLLKIQAESRGTYTCCLKYSPTMKEDPLSRDIEMLINGYGRIIYHSDKGILKIMEGHFDHGRMDQYGRFKTVIDEEREYSFTGWFPNGTQLGKGIAVFNQTEVLSGSFRKTNYFFSEQEDYLREVSSEFEIEDLSTREIPVQYLKKSEEV